MHLSPDGRLLSLTIRSRSHGTLERDQSFTPEGIPGEMVGSRVLVGDTQTGDAQTPFGPDATSWAGVWSPSGRLLAAYVQHEVPDPRSEGELALVERIREQFDPEGILV